MPNPSASPNLGRPKAHLICSSRSTGKAIEPERGTFGVIVEAFYLSERGANKVQTGFCSTLGTVEPVEFTSGHIDIVFEPDAEPAL